MKWYLVIILCAVETLFAAFGTPPGSGTKMSPYLIEDILDFHTFAITSSYWDDYVRLECDIDMSNAWAPPLVNGAVIASDTDTDELNPNNPSHNGPKYTGNFDGNDHTITGLDLTGGDSGTNFCGLFGYLNGAVVRNLRISLADVEGDGRHIGILAGYSNNSTIRNCRVLGDIVTPDGVYVGGLSGYCRDCIIDDCSGNITATGAAAIGGLAGFSRDTSFTDCSTVIAVLYGEQSMGALAGYMEDCTISNCVATTDIYAYLHGDENSNLGGLAGLAQQTDIDGSFSNTLIRSEENPSAPMSSGWVTKAGGLVGYLQGNMTDCTSTVSIVVQDATSIGGLIGGCYGDISDCHSEGAIYSLRMGGLIGDASGSVSRCSSTVTFTHSGGAGLVYENSGNISECYTTGTATGAGLVQINKGTIADCYSLSDCSAGLVANAESGLIRNCYSAGVVSDNEAGLIRTNDNCLVQNCFWDVQASGAQYSLGGGMGLDTWEMRIPETFIDAGWDCVSESVNGTDDLWYVESGSYPILAWQGYSASYPPNDAMANAVYIGLGQFIAGTNTGAIGSDITSHGYNDWKDVWYWYKEGITASKRTVWIESSFDTTLAVFDERLREVEFNDDHFKDRSAIILKTSPKKKYYFRVSGYDGQTGNFKIHLDPNAIQAIQGDLNYDGHVNLADFAIMASNWMIDW